MKCPHCNVSYIERDGLKLFYSTLQWDGIDHPMKRFEAKLFRVLLEHYPNKANNYAFQYSPNMIKVSVNKVREFLEDTGIPFKIDLIWGEGYKLVKLP
jgi:DNA-binding response OmpR family regulator